MSSTEEREESHKQRELIAQLERKTCGFTGHRPNKLENCYSFKHPMSIAIKENLTKVLEQLIEEEGIERFITGGALGFDQISFWTVHTLKKKHPHISNIVAVPFKNQSSAWRDRETLKWYDKMIAEADEVNYVDKTEGYKMNNIPMEDYHPAKMQKRNEYMVDKSRIMIALWDGSNSGGTCNCVNYISKSGRTLYWINPRDEFRLEIRYGMNE